MTKEQKARTTRNKQKKVEKKVQVQEEDNIRNYFENKSITKRIEFIEDYDFTKDKNNYDYFKSFISNFVMTKDNWYNTLIIDLSDELNIVNYELYYKYLNFFYNSNYYLFRLSILDYIANNYTFYKKIYKPEDFEAVQINRRIIKNQVIVNNLIFFPENKQYYIKELIKSFKRTDDYRSYIRLYNYVMNFELEKVINDVDLNILIEITESKNLGRSVSLKVSELKDYLNNIK